ncbi:TIGR03086 family metal-binding protein [Streptomyces sp. NBC_01013]|uniref:TIGR03086 family metal-binding protein n=1 Tax=Streptomyces sp. NBC_01013 TaxID=2903718 RepID=UPI00386AA628|nr:TIGR03086 family metal-binding protein [Streptomyces sp. NBC_01013]
MDIVQLDRAAVLESVRVVEQAGPGDWDRPTPCDRWTLRLLVEHMGTQHLGFAAAARGEGSEPAAWEPRAAGNDPVEWYRWVAHALLDAFAQPGVLERRFALPEIDAKARFPATTAIGFHFIDYVVHSWDVAAALGSRTAFAPAVLDAALPVALRVPGGERREQPGAAFRPALGPAPGDGTLRLVLSALGRSPDWLPPHGS